MADKKTNREKLKEITDSIEQGIKELFQSDKYAEYLRTMSKFHSYSVRNTILIHMQRPDATAVAGFNAWKNKFQRHVKKGEKGITILAPTPFKKKIEEKKLSFSRLCSREWVISCTAAQMVWTSLIPSRRVMDWLSLLKKPSILGSSGLKSIGTGEVRRRASMKIS